MADLARNESLAEKLADGRPNRKIRYVAKFVQAHAPHLIEDDQRWRALHLETLHRDGDTILSTGLIDTDGKGQAIFVDKHLERAWCHHVMMLKHRVETNYGHFARIKLGGDALRLGRAFAHATRAKHLKRMQDDDLPAQFRER